MELERRTVTSVATPGLVVELDIPTTWEVTLREGMPTLVAQLPAPEAGPFADNLLVTLEALSDEMPRNLEAVTAVSRAQLHTTVPDLHLLEDRPEEVAGLSGHHRALLQTAPPGLTVVTRQVFALAGDALVTVALTSFPFRDRESSELMEQILASLTIRSEQGDAA